MARNLASLVDTQKSAEFITMTLERVNKELDEYEYQQRLLGGDTQRINAMYVAANELEQHHQEEMRKLQELTADLGLLQANLPDIISEKDKPFVKQIILIHAMKTTLWRQLQRLQDELNPIRESARRSGVGRSIGKVSNICLLNK